MNTKYLCGHQFTQWRPAACSDLTTVWKNRLGGLGGLEKGEVSMEELHNSFFSDSQENEMNVGTRREHSNQCFTCLNLKF